MDKKDKLASLIYVIAENLKNKRANFYVLDKGEGQPPEMFNKTFLKFGGNKANTYFLHGRFGTGSFGVLPNSGDNKYQLILSRRSPGLNTPDSQWGWTLIRKNRTIDLNSKHAWYEYLTDNGTIHSFPREDLSEFIKSCIQYELLDLPDFQHGTLIKLFDYDLPNSSDVDRDLYRIINRYLYSPALPFRILNAQIKGHVGPGKEIDGNINRLKKNKSEIETLKIPKVLLPKLGYVDVDIYISNRQTGKKGYIESEKVTTNKEAIFFIRNGQSHGEFSREFIRNDIGLEFISKNIAIIIDCSNTPSVEFDDVFPPTRDAMRENRHRNAVESTLRNELKNHEGLKEINLRVRNSIMTESVGKTKDYETFINDLYRLDPALRKLLSGSLVVKDLSTRGTIDSEYKGSYIPTKLIVKDKEVKNTGHKSIPINTYSRLVLETDAQNDYLYREKDKGELLSDFNGKISSFMLYNGYLTIKVLPPESVEKNSEDILKISLTRPFDEPLTQEIKIKYVGPVILGNNLPTPPKPPKNKQISLPKFSSWPREKWLDAGYDQEDACEFVVEYHEINKNYVLKEVNIHKDFPWFLDYLKSQSVSPSKMEEMKQMFELSVYMSALVIHKDFSKNHSYDRDTVRIVMKQLAKSLPFTIFTMQKRWLKEITPSEEYV